MSYFTMNRQKKGGLEKGITVASGYGFVTVNQSSLFSCQDYAWSSTRSTHFAIVLVVLTQNYETIKKRMLLQTQLLQMWSLQ